MGRNQQFVDSKAAAALTGKSGSHLALLASRGRIPGAKRVGTDNNGVWLFPVNQDGGITIAPAANPVGRPKRFSPFVRQSITGRLKKKAGRWPNRAPGNGDNTNGYFVFRPIRRSE